MMDQKEKVTLIADELGIAMPITCFWTTLRRILSHGGYDSCCFVPYFLSQVRKYDE
jgi:hypothetical protein